MASESKGEPAEEVDMEAGAPVRTFDIKVLNAFLAEKAQVEGIIADIQSATEMALGLVAEASAAFDPAKEAEISQNLVRNSKAASLLAKKAKGMLDKMQADGREMEKRYGSGDRTYKVYKIHYDRLVMRYVDAAKQYQKAKFNAVDASKSTLTRRAKVFFPEKSDEEIEREIEVDPTGLASRAIVYDQVANEKAQQAYNDVQTRAREVELLANSVREVYDIFQDFAIMVAEQHEQINSIEDTIEQAAKVIGSGNKKLADAIEYQRKMRKKNCCILVVVVVIVVVLVAALGGSAKSL